MPPSFFAKFVRGTSPPLAHSRDRSTDKSPRNSASRRPSLSQSAPPPLPPPPLPDPPVRVPTFISTTIEPPDDPAHDSDSTFPSVQVVPPSPHIAGNGSLYAASSQSSLSSNHNRGRDHSPSLSPSSSPCTQPRSLTKSSSRQSLRAQTLGHTLAKSPSNKSLRSLEDDLPTPTVPDRPSPSKTPQVSQQPVPALPADNEKKPQSSPDLPAGNLKGGPAPLAMSLLSPISVRKRSSNRGLKQPPPITVTQPRAATAPTGHAAPSPTNNNSHNSQNGQTVIYRPNSHIVDSPTESSPPPLPSAPGSGSTYLTAQSPRDPDSISLVSTSSRRKDVKNKEREKGKDKDKDKDQKDKKRASGWRRPSATKKPTGLASALAASSLSLANHGLTAGQQAHLAIAASPPTNGGLSPKAGRKVSASSGSPPYTPTTSGMVSSASLASKNSRHVKSRSEEKARLSPGLTKKAMRSATYLPRSRSGTTSLYNDGGNGDYLGDDRAEYFSGLEESSSEGSGSGSEDDLLDLDLGEDSIPVTGFAVASNKRNADFHELFPNVPEGDYLIDDYGCALQREILIQGRLYISENHVCFHANILGWITDLSVPINEIISLEKRMTAFVIPNGLQIITRRAKYTFASFLSRDTTFDVIYNIWKLERQDDVLSVSDASVGRPHPGGDGEPGPNAVENEVATAVASVQHKVTFCACGRAGQHLSETALETVVPGPPERIHNLIFASGFMKDFLSVNQKLLDIQISDWLPVEPGSKLLARNMSYIKPLNNNIGPKQTKCEIRDETVHADFDDYAVMLTTTRTPDVPSGNVFTVKTRTCIMWASAVSTRIVVTSQVEWTGRSFIKGIIERSANEGQKMYHADLEKAMCAYIEEHQSEFVPVGVDPAAAIAVALDATPPTLTAHEGEERLPPSEEETRRQREHERNQRGLQWAYETLSGTLAVARQSTKGALELVREAWEQSSTTTILYFVVVGLVLSNVWTLMKVGSSEIKVRRKMMKRDEDREKVVQAVVAAIWDELGAAKIQGRGRSLPVPATATLKWKDEVAQLHEALDAIEARVKAIRGGIGLAEADTLDK